MSEINIDQTAIHAAIFNALNPFGAGQYGDLALSADRAAVIAARVVAGMVCPEFERLSKGHVCTERCKPNAHVAFTGRQRLNEAEAEVERLRVERDWLLAEADDDTRTRFYAARRESGGA